MKREEGKGIVCFSTDSLQYLEGTNTGTTLRDC
jgi:hypothetical protein